MEREGGCSPAATMERSGNSTKSGNFTEWYSSARRRAHGTRRGQERCGNVRWRRAKIKKVAVERRVAKRKQGNVQKAAQSIPCTAVLPDRHDPGLQGTLLDDCDVD